MSRIDVNDRNAAALPAVPVHLRGVMGRVHQFVETGHPPPPVIVAGGMAARLSRGKADAGRRLTGTPPSAASMRGPQPRSMTRAPLFDRNETLPRGELKRGRKLAVAVGKRAGNFRQGGRQFLLKTAPDVGYGVGNGHGGVSLRAFCCLQDPSRHGETPRPGKSAKKNARKAQQIHSRS